MSYIVSYLSKCTLDPHSDAQWIECSRYTAVTLQQAELLTSEVSRYWQDALHRLTFGDSNTPLALYRNGERVEIPNEGLVEL